MKKQIDVLTFGDLCVDLIVDCAGAIPEFGQREKLVRDYSLEMGGSCSIFACQAAKLGLNTSVVGTIGDDQFGSLIYKILKESGVHTDYVRIDGQYKTGVSVALNNKSDRAILTYNGTIDGIERSDIAEGLLRSARHLHIGSYFLMKKIQPYYPEILKKLKEYGATISLDINWDPEEKWDSGIWNVLPYIDVFFPNENEIMAITGKSSIENAIDKLKGIVPIIALKKGKEGAEIYSQGNKYFARALEVEIADAVGAGDSFDAGFIYGMLKGLSLEMCAKIGCICGSLNTRITGGVKGQPGLEQMLAYIRE
jgi:sugar/nucleoside kinase (ribokinase family)